MITTIILFVLLVFSVFAIFTQFVSNAFSFNDGLKGGITREIGPRLEECILEDHDAANKIAVIPVEGTITDQSTDRMDNSMVDVIRAQLDRAKKDHRVKAVVLKVDSPGGEVLATDEIGKAIARFQEDSGKPVICSMQPGGIGRLLHSHAMPLDCSQPFDHHRQYRRDSGHMELPRPDGQGGARAGDLQERQVQGHVEWRTQHK